MRRLILIYSTANDPPGECVTCPPGYYCPRDLMTAPIVCPAGYYCEESCVVPAPCDRGYYCPEGFWLPFECYPGTFNDQFHQSTCKSCPAGYYCPESGTTEPLKCSTDLISSVGATFCQKCPLGHVCSTGVDVGLCPSGGYCTNGVYRSCPAGKRVLSFLSNGFI